LLLAAFAISLLIHLAWALLVHRTLPTSETQIETVTIRHRLTMSTRPTPPPLPKRTPVPHPAATSRPLPRATQATQSTGGQGGNAHATAAPTPEPTAVATGTPNPCARNDIDAVVLSTPAPPDIPVAARSEATSGTTLVDVKLDARGTVTGAAVSKSSGNSSLDVVALGMARDSTYSPATHDCKPVASTYSFSVKFVAW
jgi:TonB family protein